MTRHIATITDVAERQLCTGCGACAYAQPDAITMVDDLDAGRRPIVSTTHAAPGETDAALGVCPGIGLSHSPTDDSSVIGELRGEWGPVLEVWEGFAADDEIRWAGSSGGVATALALHCLEEESMAGVLHIRARPEIPYLNETVLSKDRAQLMGATGSRYAPASPCERLDLVEAAEAPCVFIGKPCDVAATSKARQSSIDLDRNLGLTIGIFCAGTPTTRGTLEMLNHMGVDPDELTSLRYRGNGWPGQAAAQGDAQTEVSKLTYDESWGKILQRHRQWRCYVCADHTGEFADIAVGDPWYREVGAGEAGQSLILVRTDRGRQILARAIEAGAITAERAEAKLLPASQPGLQRVRGSVGGRILALRLLRLPAPTYSGFPMMRTWWQVLSPRAKVRSTLGTFTRVRRRRLRHAVPVRPFSPRQLDAPTTMGSPSEDKLQT